MVQPSPPERALTSGTIFWFWLPLAASWALMTLEGPTIQATIARLPSAQTMLAAAGIVLSMEVTFESPIIMLLATSTALAKTPQAYRLLCRFVLHLTLGLTAVAATVAFVDPVYAWLIPGLMGIPEPIATAAQPAMQIMTLWSAAIGWRRFYQGILIRFGQTRQVGYGTAVRLMVIAPRYCDSSCLGCSMVFTPFSVCLVRCGLLCLSATPQTSSGSG